MKLKLTQGKVTIVDAEDYAELNKYKWYFLKGGYAVRQLSIGKGKQKLLYLHKELIKPPKGYECDHINRDKLDNRRANLRVVTHRQNMMNRPSKGGGSSKHKGVYWDNHAKKWGCEVYNGNKERVFRSRTYKTELEAAIVYNEYAKKHYGEYAYLNTV